MEMRVFCVIREKVTTQCIDKSALYLRPRQIETPISRRYV